MYEQYPYSQQTYGVNTQNPYISRLNSYYTQPVQSPTQLIRVNGFESAKAYQTVPNSTVALFDANEDIMYIKSTDASNFPNIRRFRFIEEPLEAPITNAQYVTLEEFNKFKEEILNGKQSIQLRQLESSKSKGKSNDSTV